MEKISKSGHTSGQCRIMGILNVTPDSFSDGGKYLDLDVAVKHAMDMVAWGADIIDVGGESSRPGAHTVPAKEEIRRVVPVITALRKHTDVTISIDTVKYSVACAALEAGAHIVNDISALQNSSNMVQLIASKGAGVVLMHMQGTPRTMQHNPQYSDVVREVHDFLAQRVTYATAHGISQQKIWIDPGIGFGKTVHHNLLLIKHLDELLDIGCPILVGLSRKSFIHALCGAPVEQRLGGSIASAVLARQKGALIFRVHDVPQTVQALRIAEAVIGA